MPHIHPAHDPASSNTIQHHSAPSSTIQQHPAVSSSIQHHPIASRIVWVRAGMVRKDDIPTGGCSEELQHTRLEAV
ncbi:hypothetical protein E2C01_073330 [Portunus trituberculatus]|uniref:Uncharacterized protein n=1 Tax=Portunus trituberculatus TaxID=210409 RepID=A0A5B7I528_PORTR|nr:hypothetical protein [Portunus trituberculatus]